MKYKKIVLGLLTICATSTLLNAASSWTSGAYANNTNVTKKLEINGAKTLIVDVSGETESYFDFLSIKDSNGKEIKKLSGQMHDSFEVSGSLITINFTSDASVTKSGVTVSIINKQANQTKSLILNPKKGTVLTHGSISFEVAEGVKRLDYTYLLTDGSTYTSEDYSSIINENIPMTHQKIKELDTTLDKIKVCAYKNTTGTNPSCIVYDIEKYNPFDAKIVDSKITFKNATTLYRIPRIEGSKKYDIENVSGKTSVDFGDPHDFGAVNLCGYVGKKWTCQALTYFLEYMNP